MITEASRRRPGRTTIASDAPGLPALRAATWNLLHGMDVRTGRVDLEALAGAIVALDVDVLAVQEVDRGLDRSGSVEQVAELARLLGWHGAFAPAILGDPGRRWDAGPGAGPDAGGPAYGVGLLSRHPLLDVQRRALPGGGAGERKPRDAPSPWPGWDREGRAVLRARVAPDGGPAVTVATAHLSYLVWRGVRQLRTALAWVGTGGGPALLMGDLNLPGRLLRPALAGTGWTTESVGPTFPSWRPGVQLDHVLGRGVHLRDVRVGPLGPSDHLPVRADVVPVAASTTGTGAPTP